MPVRRNQAVDDSGVREFNSGTWDSLNQSTKPQFLGLSAMFSLCCLGRCKSLDEFCSTWVMKDKGCFITVSGALKLKLQFTTFHVLFIGNWNIRHHQPTFNLTPSRPRFFSLTPSRPRFLNVVARFVQEFWIPCASLQAGARPDLLVTVAWRLHPQIASHQVAYGNTRQNKIQKSSLGCLCLCIRHVKTSFPIENGIFSACHVWL